MKRKGIRTLVVILCLSCLGACSSDSDKITDKELLNEALAKGSWQVAFQHSLSKRELEHPQIKLTFSELGKVQANHESQLSDNVVEGEGAYSLVYDKVELKSGNWEADDESDEVHFGSDKDDDELFLSLAFGTKELLLFNHRWKVKRFTSTLVELRANDLSLRLSKSDD
ncbi:hypothetical protein [Carboxylicivirga sp. N1Y90]|uniref:hypothetical protein n=1 Tax=Carboxylicivirga fragile TaxID=3417571 RepID=UPI003D3348B7|nr:hypothetical protein [Marinilabiliaceae bacterium N1Y90]